MKEINSSSTQYKILPPTISIKFKDSFKIEPVDRDKTRQYFLKCELLPWKEIEQKFPGVKIDRLFTSVSPGILFKLIDRTKEIDPGYTPPNFFNYFSIEYANETNAGELLAFLRKQKTIEKAYFETEFAPPPGETITANPGTMKQGYLNAAPKGINAKYAWSEPGGRGRNVKLIDIEQGWYLTHEDLLDASRHPLVSCIWGRNEIFFQHGCSVLGVIMMQDNSSGGIGIAPEVNARVISERSETGHRTVHNALIKAVEKLDAGDIILLESQVTDRDLNLPYWPAEIKPSIFEGIKFATASGITVIECAANADGDDAEGKNLDDFPVWSGENIFDTSRGDFKDSGAIMVAGSSSSNGHGKTRTSNYGSRIDCFAWGEDVYSSVIPPDQYYDAFNGTSSAGAIIAGAAILVQSINIARGRRPLSPASLRDILRNKANGSSSRDNIGIMPDLKFIIDNVL